MENKTNDTNINAPKAVMKFPRGFPDSEASWLDYYLSKCGIFPPFNVR